ncbi:ATPase [Aliigemmobacter aestuarii]|uniref:ATPase n=1 Tax=Aliigemmobacter aestuarii TaxID=1445661 RepID=A0A4S3MRN9_9RHOB|nr:ATP12 family protein [Gemmobacter aestuarii]THD85206.1 ATPase [Gemmobacter aestuarii]
MTGWTAKRFWKTATAEPCEGGFTVRLDGRPVKTPAKAPLVVPTRALAEAIAAEWNAQDGVVRPETMPCTRTANSAIDKVRVQFADVAGMIAAYGASDLLCYRAEEPEGLVIRQKTGWDPLLDWAHDTQNAPLKTGIGVIPVPQDAASLDALAQRVRSTTAFELAALHDLVAISGSLVLGLAVIDGRLSAEEAWTLSRIDETWQAELWGEDEEAAESAARKRADLLHAARFYGLCR